MGMSIKTNVGGNTACGNLKKSGKKGDKNLQKLASGYRINNAADDASGMGITEKMRAQISALETITPGCQDGINLLSTADGYLDEMQNMLVRMTELSEKSANGILEDETDREALQEEMNQLGAEIDRIADTANFNGNKLFVPRTVTIVHVETSTRTAYTSETVDNTDRFSNPAPNYMKLTPSLCTAINEDEQMRGDTLTKLADEIQKYMDSQNPKLTNMVKGKMYYNKDGVCKFVPHDSDGNPGVLSDADKAVLGNPRYSVDTFPNPEPRYYTYTLPVCKEHIDVNYSKSNTIGGSGIAAQERTYKFIEGFTNKYLKELTDKYGEDVSAKEQEIKGKSLFYNKNREEAVVAEKAPAPESDWYTARISYIPKRETPVEQTVEINPLNHSKQSYIKSSKEELHTETRNEVTHPPITLQVGETSERADKLNIELYDLHTDKLFHETRTLLGYKKKQVFHPATEGHLEFGQISGNLDGVSGSVRYVPGREAYTSWEDDHTRPIEDVKNAIKDNTETSAYEHAVTLDISNQDYAISNITHAREVTDKISLIRASYGAISNRLEKTISNHENTIENMSSAKSRIKDTDMAKEMMEYTQNNVVTQSAQSMLAQANTRPQDVLQLLQ